ncbi:hypothetical protein [Polynucleobacter rarus]|uniref:hypothetical protein n=1 Tax=Polynucleobacter rarus TaxID=556055 RepID=UPI00131F425B|nr:hypothetical protein [Polynucleobacter rarus]
MKRRTISKYRLNTKMRHASASAVSHMRCNVTVAPTRLAHQTAAPAQQSQLSSRKGSTSGYHISKPATNSPIPTC